MASGVITGNWAMEVYRMATLKAALKLEIAGMTRHGRSAYSLIKEEYGWKGRRERILNLLEARIVDMKAEHNM